MLVAVIVSVFQEPLPAGSRRVSDDELLAVFGSGDGPHRIEIPIDRMRMEHFPLIPPHSTPQPFWHRERPARQYAPILVPASPYATHPAAFAVGLRIEKQPVELRLGAIGPVAVGEAMEAAMEKAAICSAP